MRQALFVIVIGYFEMLKCLCCGCLLCVFLPIVFIAARRAQQPQWVQAAPQVVQNLYKAKYQQFSRQGQAGENACPICLVDYTEEDEITPLPCDDRHFFHSDCIQGWLDKNNICPMCKQPVT